MLKYYNYDVVMAEVPDEVTLAINITNCPCHCEGCHTPILSKDFGEELSINELYRLISENRGITCVAFMGGDSDPAEVTKLATAVKCRSDYPYRVAWYSGRSSKASEIDLSVFNYIKLGPYIKDLGPLNKPTTNQKFYEVVMTREIDEDNNPIYALNDITYKFWKNEKI